MKALNHDREEEVEVDYHQQKITIWVNKDLHKVYSEYYQAAENRVILSSFFAVPALEDVLAMLKSYGSRQERDQEFGTYKWYQVIRSKLSENKIDLDKEDSVMKIANRLLPHVFKSNLEEFGNIYRQFTMEK